MHSHPELLFCIYLSFYKDGFLLVDLINMFFKLVRLLSAICVLVLCQEIVDEAKGIVRVLLLIKKDTVRRVHVVIFIFNLRVRTVSKKTCEIDHL